jgi:hypothetical protein
MTTRSRWTAAAVLILATAILPLRPASIDDPVRMLPWLHEGMVLTYTWYAARAPGNGSDYQEDEHGNWVDSNGRRYSRSTQQGTSGSGWNEITVACIDGQKAVLSIADFGDAGALGNNQPVPMQDGRSYVASVADPGDFWMDPGKLSTLHSAPAERVLVTHAPWTGGGRSIDAVRVQVVKEGNYSDHVFDAKTGLCLHFAGSVQGAAPRLVGPGDFGQGDTTLTHGDFVSTHDLSIPWALEAPPDWVQVVRALHYQGSWVSRGPLPTVPNTISIDMEPLTRGRGWIELASTVSSEMRGMPRTAPDKSRLAAGRSQFGGLWAGPGALAKLQQGQVLDEDPVTKMKTYVARIDEHSVLISSVNAAGELDSEYDSHTGMLIGMGFFDVLNKRQYTLRLQSHQ